MRLDDHMFKVQNGVTTAVPSAFKTKGLINDIALYPPTYTQSRASPNSKAPANGYRYNFYSVQFTCFRKLHILNFVINNNEKNINLKMFL